MRLIDADALESVYDDKYSLGEIGRRERDDVVDALRYCATTVDAMPVVRCRDCKYRYVDGDNVRFNLCLLNHNKVQSDDWYCADGDRKGGDE